MEADVLLCNVHQIIAGAATWPRQWSEYDMNGFSLVKEVWKHRLAKLTLEEQSRAVHAISRIETPVDRNPMSYVRVCRLYKLLLLLRISTI